MDGLGEKESQSMTLKPPAMKIFLWCEVVAAVGVVLFYIAVFLNKFFTDVDFNLSIYDRFAAVPVFMALFYFVAATVALCGHKLWPLLQYMVTVLALFLTLAFSRTLQNAGRPFELVFFLPLICSVLASSVVYISQKSSTKKEAL